MSSFFSELASLARKVEKEVKELQSNTENAYKATRSEDELEEGKVKASLLLRNLDKEIKDLKVQIQKSNSDLRGSGFVEIVDTAKALIELQKKSLNDTVGYLQQYGYKPLEPPTTNPSQQNSTNVSNSVPCAQDNGNKQHKKLCSENYINSPDIPVLTTPGIKQIAALKSRVPLEARTREGQAETWPTNLNTPNSQATLGRSCDQHNIGPLTDEDLLKTPEMPELTFNYAALQPFLPKCAPGDGKPIAATQINTAPAPQQITVASTPEMSAALISLALEKKHMNCTSAVGALQNLGGVTICDTPEMPELTFKFDLATAPKATLNGCTTATPDLPTTTTCVLGMQSRDQRVSAFDRVPDLKSGAVACDTPEMPELTYKFNLAAVMNTHTTTPDLPATTTCSLSPETANNRLSACNRVPELRSTALNGCDTPEMPELTFKFDDLQTLRAIYTRDSNLQSSSNVPPRSEIKTELPSSTSVMGFRDQNVRQQRNDIYKQPSLVSNRLDGKENVEPVVNFECLINDEEYNAQPYYITRHISLEKLNQNINLLRDILTRKKADGLEDYITEPEMREFMGYEAKSVLLCLTRLEKLTRVKTGHSEPSYRFT